jgi:serine protease Do
LSGALVSSVEPDSEAGELGLVPGDVIINVQGQPVATPEEVRRALQAAHDERRHYLAMLVQGKHALRWISLSITNVGS